MHVVSRGSLDLLLGFLVEIAGGKLCKHKGGKERGSKKALQEKGIIKGSSLFVHITGEMVPKNCTQLSGDIYTVLLHYVTARLSTLPVLYTISMLILLFLFRKSGVDVNADKTVV